VHIIRVVQQTKGHSERFVEEENTAKEIMEQNQLKFTSVELHSQGTTAKAKKQFFSTRQTRGDQNTTSSMGTENVVLPDAAFLRKVLDKLMVEDPNPKGNAPVNSMYDIVPVAHRMTYPRLHPLCVQWHFIGGTCHRALSNSLRRIAILRIHQVLTTILLKGKQFSLLCGS
jgi:hypothetical protein